MFKLPTKIDEIEHVQKPLLDALNMLPGCWATRCNSGNVEITDRETGKNRWMALAKKGTADVIGCYKGIFFGIEVKKPGGIVKIDQIIWLKNIIKLGGIAFVADDWRKAVEQLQKEVKLYAIKTPTRIGYDPLLGTSCKIDSSNSSQRQRNKRVAFQLSRRARIHTSGCNYREDARTKQSHSGVIHKTRATATQKG